MHTLEVPARSRLWKTGKETSGAGEVFVSMNDYQVHRLVDVPLVWWEGLRFRHAWPRTDGALGLWFMTLPKRRSVSVSIWRSQDDLRGFVRSPRHAEIMRRYQGRGDLITTAWTAERFDRWLILQQAVERLSRNRS